MNYATFKAARASIEAEIVVASAALQQFPRLANGLTPDAVKALPVWRAAKANYDRLFAAQRALNGAHAARFSREIRADRDAAREARRAA